MTTPDLPSVLDVPVLIVGGGPVGLTASLLLARLGIESLLVERHAGTARLPKARALNARTMEMYRQLGLEDEIRAVGMDPRFSGMILWSESLAGREIHRLHPRRTQAGQPPVSAVAHCGCSQDVLEPVLRQRAEAAGPGRVRFGTELAHFHLAADGVAGTLRDRADRADRAVTPFHARYLIAADGAQSSVRGRLGIATAGERDVYDSLNIHFEADLTPWVAGRPAALYLIEQPDLRGTFLTIDGSYRWSFLVTSMSHYGYRAEDFDAERCCAVIRQAVGVDHLPIRILGIGAWTASAVVADRYREGSVFLAGDAAHEMPPTGGLGLNTGVQDVQNLCWKLAAVLRGEAGAGLLDSYADERRPLGELTVRTALLNALSMGRTARQSTAVLPREQFLNEQGLVWGATYRSAAVSGEARPADPAIDPITDYVPSADPGRRAPHVRLEHASGATISTIDLYGDGFVLLAGAEGQAWAEAAAALDGPAVRAWVVGGQEVRDVDGRWRELYAAGPGSAVLVRPDGIVAWRAETLAADPAATLRAALDALLDRREVVQRQAEQL